MTLRQKQSKFAKMTALLILYIYECGYEVTYGDAYRDPRSPYGTKNSAHHKRLALDLNLFLNGRYLKKTEHHRKFGEFWESLDAGNKWGGRFKRPDGNHYQY